MRSLVTALLLLSCVSCMHRHAATQFGVRQCAAGTREVVVNVCTFDSVWSCQPSSKCALAEKVPVQGMSVLHFDLPLLEKGQDPNDIDGDEGAAADHAKPKRSWKSLWLWKRVENDRD